MDVEQKPVDLEDWGLNHPFVVVWREFIREYRSNFSSLPDPNHSIFEQDNALMDDLNTIGALFSHHMRRLKVTGGTAPPPPDYHEIYD